MATLTEYGAVRWKIGENIIHTYGIVTHVGAADLGSVYTQLPLRADGKRYRLVLLAHLQNSGGAATVTTEIYPPDMIGPAMVWTGDSTTTSVGFKVSWSSDIVLSGGAWIRTYASSLGAAKYLRQYALWEVVD